MMHYVHTGEAVVTSIKIDIFLLVTTRPIAHSGRFVCIEEYGRENAKHLFAYLMRERACQLDISDTPSCGCKLTSETIPISIGGP